MLTGLNARSPDHTLHRGASCPAFPAPCDVVPGVSDWPDDNLLPGGLLEVSSLEDTVPVTRWQNASVVSQSNNWGVTLLMAGLASQRTKMTECLQDQTTFLRKTSFCRAKRPRASRSGPEVTNEQLYGEFGFLVGYQAPQSRFAPPPPPSPPPKAAVLGVGGNEPGQAWRQSPTE